MYGTKYRGRNSEFRGGLSSETKMYVKKRRKYWDRPEAVAISGGGGGGVPL